MGGFPNVTCDPALVLLHSQSVWGKSAEEAKRIMSARDAVRSNRRTTVHRFAAIRWYKPAAQRTSSAGPLIAAPVLLTRPDLIQDIWWRDQYQDADSKFVPLAAIIGGFIQYPLPRQIDPSGSKFRLIQIPRRVFSA